jgi:5-methylcytosine-specific restriction endonuclease McrA
MDDLFVKLIMLLPLNKSWLYRNFYLRSRHWKQFRAGVLGRDRYRCRNCGGTGKDVHHLRYYRDGRSILWREEKSDCKVLCRKCHTKES